MSPAKEGEEVNETRIKDIEIWNEYIRTEGGTEREKPRCERGRERERESRDRGGGPGGGGEKGAVAQEKGRLFSMESTPTSSWRDAGGRDSLVGCRLDSS